MAARTFNERLAWRAQRAEIVQRDGCKCVLCGARFGLTVHHIRPQALGRDDSPTNLVTLCAAHHAALELLGQRLAACIVWMVSVLMFAVAR